uniref:uncharacterized protein isoform X2 n=1 Tax=Pristiophorus japonicus TaxID=55135 RepID=UPI00398F5B23
MTVKTVKWISGRLSVYCKEESKILVWQKLVWPPVEAQLKTTDLVPNEVRFLESQRSTALQSEITHSASDGELGRKISLTPPEEQRCYSDTERQHRESLKITSKLKNSTPLVSSKSRIQNFSAILRSKDVLRVQNKSIGNNEGAQCLDPKEGQSFDEAAIKIPSRLSDPLGAKRQKLQTDGTTSLLNLKEIKANHTETVRKNLEMETCLLTPPDTLQKMILPSDKIPGRISMKRRIPANKEHTSGDSSTVQQSAKTPSEGPYSDSNCMGQDEAMLTPFLHYKPQRLFTSAEKYQNAEEPEETVQVIEGEFSELDDGDLSDPNISAAFQNFTEEMRKKLRFCYRRMERYTRQSLQSAEENISTLLNQIHNYRLNALTSSSEDKLGMSKEIRVNTTQKENEGQLASMKETSH